MRGPPIAAGVPYQIFGILLSPMIAASAMSFSSVSYDCQRAPAYAQAVIILS